MPVYINITSGRDVETIDEFDTWKEARRMIAEYRLVYQGTEYRAYLSRRSTKAWREAGKVAEL